MAGGTQLHPSSYSIPVAIIIDLASYSDTTASPVLAIDVTSRSRTVADIVPYVDPMPCFVPEGPIAVVASCSIAAVADPAPCPIPEGPIAVVSSRSITIVADPTPCSVPEGPIAIAGSSSITTVADPVPCFVPEGPIVVVGSSSIVVIEVSSNPTAVGAASNPILYKGPTAVTCTTSSSADPKGASARINTIPHTVVGTAVPA